MAVGRAGEINVPAGTESFDAGGRLIVPGLVEGHRAALQEGLMRSRMVPFSRMVPRLRRIVRQISGEVNKKVDLRLKNIEGELDRNVLERLVAPLEHMIRNAVDHGLERFTKRFKLSRDSLGLRIGAVFVVASRERERTVGGAFLRWSSFRRGRSG